MESLKNRMHISDFSLLTDGIAIGLLGGSASVFYRLMLSYVGKLRSFLMTSVKWERNVLWFFLIIGISFVVCRLLKWEPLSGGSGIPQISGEMLGRFSMNPFRVLISKIAGGALVNFSGFSLGREGPSIQIGAATGKLCAKWMRRGGREEKIMTSAGAGAGLAAAFSAPIAGTIFVFEELHKTFSRALIIPTFYGVDPRDVPGESGLWNGAGVSIHSEFGFAAVVLRHSHPAWYLPRVDRGVF